MMKEQSEQKSKGEKHGKIWGNSKFGWGLCLGQGRAAQIELGGGQMALKNRLTSLDFTLGSRSSLSRGVT